LCPPNYETSFSASPDGSLKDVELPGSVTPEPPGKANSHEGDRATLAEVTPPPQNPDETSSKRESTWDFDALYRGESPAEGVPAVTSVPWDTKAPKENVIAWQDDGLIKGHVLDIGCGLGDNAIYLAKNGHHVTALDISATALFTAERRAADAGVDVKFAVSDARGLHGYTDTFDTVIDVGMFHCLDEGGKAGYAAAAHRAARPGATLLMACFSDVGQPDPDLQHRGVSEQSLHTILGGAGWSISSLDHTTVQRPGQEFPMAFWLVRAERL
jgi:SAM-dependent methyltransferase